MAEDAIAQARGAGYSDAEISQFLAPRMEAAKQAGYSDEEIQAHLGIKPPTPVKTPNWWERTGIARPGSLVAEKGIFGAIESIPSELADWWHNTPSALEQSATLRDKQAAADKAWEAQSGTKLEPGRHAPGSFDLTFSNPMLFSFTPGEGLARGFGKGKNAALDMLGGKAAADGPEAAAAAGVAGDVPKPEAFDTAARALETTPERLRLVYEKTGITPDGVAADAAKDPTIAADLVSTNRDIPAAYDSLVKHGELVPEAGGGKDVGPPNPPEPPEPPAAGSFEDAQGKILAKISVGDHEPKTPLTLSRLYTMFVDQLYPIAQAVKDTMAGRPIAAADNPNILARLTRGVFGKADQFLERGTFDFSTYETSGPGLKQILEPVMGDLQGLRAYAASWRALELASNSAKVESDLVAARAKVADAKAEKAKFDDLTDLGAEKRAAVNEAKTAWTKEIARREQEVSNLEKKRFDPKNRENPSGLDLDAAKVVAEHGPSQEKYAPVLRNLVDYQNRLTGYLRDSGVLSDKAYDAMVEGNKYFVPFYRMMDDGVAGPAGGGRGLQSRNPLKKLKGSERDVIDPLESVIKNTYLYLSLAEKNAVGVKLIDMLEDPKALDMRAGGAPEPKTGTALATTDMHAPASEPLQIGSPGVEVLEPPPAKNALPPPDSASDAIVEYLGAHGVDPEGAEHLAAVFRYNVEGPGKIAVFRDGKRTVYGVNTELAEAFKGLDVDTANFLTKVLAVPARLLRAGSVLSPDFIPKNFIRDQFTAFVFARGVLTPVDTLRGMFSLIKQDEFFQNWMKGGGANAALMSLDRRYIQSRVFDLADETGLQRSWNVVGSFGAAERAASATIPIHPIEALRVVSELIENATRIGAFRHAIGDSTTKGDIQSAAFVSREATVDFARMGSQIRSINMISTFFNAGVQGIDRTIRAAKDDPVGFTAKGVVGLTVPSVMLWMANHDDPRYQDVPDWEKALFWHVYTKDHIYRIPKPQELGLVFATAPERILDAIHEANPKAIKDLGAAMLQLIPNPTPTVLTPVVEQFANHSTFTGGPIIPSYAEKLLPEYQYTPYTTETAKALGRLVGSIPGVDMAALDKGSMVVGGTARALTSPIIMENYVRAWTGGLGNYTLGIIDKGLRTAGVVDDPTKPTPTLADIPVVKAFVTRYPSASAQSIQDFYENYGKKREVFDTYTAMARQGNDAAAERVMSMGVENFAKLQGMTQALAVQTEAIRGIYRDPNMKDFEKRQLIDPIYYGMISIAHSGNDILQALDKAGK